MAATPVLADSSYYIRLLQAGRDPLRFLALAAATRDLVICGVVRCEVVRVIRRTESVDRFHAAWDVMINVPLDRRLFDHVEATARELDRAGVVLPLTDLMIACCAQRAGAVVLTFDKHFADIPGVRVTDRLDI